MKKIIVKSITLQNLMGCQNLTVNFNEEITNIFGRNGAGKSRLQNSFNWILFGKNADDKKDFSIKNTKDISFNQQDHVGYLVLDVDGQEVTLKRIYKEIWRKVKGNEFPEFKGHETEYEFNKVPMNATEYSKKVDSILNETVFKMITNPLYFTSLDWKKQRAVLTEICPAPSNEQLAGTSEQYQELIKNLVQGKELEDYRKQIANTIVESKKKIALIPTRIDEALKGKSDVFDFVALEKEKTEKESELSKVETDLQDKASAFDDLLAEESKKKVSANGIKSELETIKQNIINSNSKNSAPDDSKLKTAKSTLESKQTELTTAENGLKTLETKKTNLELEIQSIEEKLSAKRAELKTASEKEFVFDKNQCVCPTCKREFESSDIEAKEKELKQNFNIAQSKEIEEIQNSGVRLKGEKESNEAELKTVSERIEKGKKVIFDLQTEVELWKSNVEIEEKALNSIETKTFDLETALYESKEYQAKLAEYNKVSATIQDNPIIDNSELNEKKSQLVSEIDAIKAKLRNKDQNDLIDKRVSELTEEQKTLASGIANVEKELFVIESFNKLKVESIEKQVNEKFKYVTFRLFKDLINGGQEEVCEALVDGVPFADANTAGKINAGIDIINLLSDHFQCSAPIIIDNRESVTNVIETDSQIINLIVSDSHETLTIE